MWEEPTYTKPKESIKFRAGLNFVKIANGDTDE